jgi:hypothetical protein
MKTRFNSISLHHQWNKNASADFHLFGIFKHNSGQYHFAWTLVVAGIGMSICFSKQ